MNLEKIIKEYGIYGLLKDIEDGSELKEALICVFDLAFSRLTEEELEAFEKQLLEEVQEMLEENKNEN